MIEIHPLVHDAVVSWAPFALATSVLGAIALGVALLASRLGARRMSSRSRYMLLSIALIVPAAAAFLVPTRIGGWASALGSPGDGGAAIAEGMVDTDMRFTAVAGGDTGSDVLCVLAAVWGAGLLVILFARSGQWTMWRRVVRRSGRVDDPRLIVAFRRAAGSGGSTPELRVSRHCDEPMVVGLAFPVVLVPHGYGDAMEDAELEAVAVHELEHLRRRDNLDAALIDLFVALFWFDPFRWIARRRLLALREGACDERVLERGLPALAYLAALAKTSHAAIESPVVACMSGFRIRERMDSIMTYTNRSSQWIPESLLRVAALAMLVIVAIAIAGFAPAAAEESGFAKFEAFEGNETVDTVMRPVEAANTKVRKPAEKVTAQFDDVDVREFARVISGITGVQIAVAAAAQGKVTVHERDVPWDKVVAKAVAPLGLRLAFKNGEAMIVPAGDGAETAMPTPIPPPPPGYVRIGGDVKAPQVLTRVDPQFTEEARKERVQGLVIIDALVGEDGTVRDVKVIKGLPFGLDQAAADAVRQWTFTPATKDGKPVPVAFTLTINFKLDAGKKAEEKQ